MTSLRLEQGTRARATTVAVLGAATLRPFLSPADTERREVELLLVETADGAQFACTSPQITPDGSDGAFRCLADAVRDVHPGSPYRRDLPATRLLVCQGDLPALEMETGPTAWLFSPDDEIGFDDPEEGEPARTHPTLHLHTNEAYVVNGDECLSISPEPYEVTGELETSPIGDEPDLAEEISRRGYDQIFCTN